MKILFKTIILVFVSVIILSCNQDGCTDCNATNYDSNADVDDNSCLYLNENRIGFYSVTDSIKDYTQSVYYDNYIIEIKRGSCNSTDLLISNYSNLGNDVSVTCTVEGDSIFIEPQSIDFNNIEITSSIIGYFSNDSIYLPLCHQQLGDPYTGDYWGVKN